MSLLKPILRPILAPVIGQRGGHVITEQWVYRLDGATKYWQLSEPIIIPANVNYEIGFYASRAVNDTNLLYIFGYSLGNVDDQHRLALSGGVPQRAFGMGFTAKDFNFNGDGQFTLTHDGTSKVTFINFNTTADSFNDQTITIDRLMGPWLGVDSGYLNGYVRDFYVKVDGVEILRIPLTNKAQGATQLATVGNINATIINFTEDGWEKLKKQQSVQVTTSDGMLVATSDNKLVTTR